MEIYQFRNFVLRRRKTQRHHSANIQGVIDRILSDFSKLSFAKSNRTFAAVRLLPPLENECGDGGEDSLLNRILRTNRDRVAIQRRHSQSSLMSGRF